MAGNGVSPQCRKSVEITGQNRTTLGYRRGLDAAFLLVLVKNGQQ